MVRVGYPEAGVAWEAATAPSRPNIELISNIGAILGARGATRAASTGAKSAVHTRFGCLKVDTDAAAGPGAAGSSGRGCTATRHAHE